MMMTITSMNFLVLSGLFAITSGLATRPSFPCSDNRAVKFRFVCNGQKECELGEDELFCPDLQTTANATSPACDSDSGHAIVSETNCQMACPKFCICYGDAVVAASDVKTKLTSLDVFPPTSRFLNLNGLDLSSLTIPHLLNNLLELHLKSCRLQNLQFLITKNMTSSNLYKLDLSQNSLRELKNDGDIAVLKNLQFLNLSYNPTFETLDYFSISSTRLRSLDLSFTSISVLNSQVFENNYKHLTYLNLRGTNIQTFNFLTKLTTLDHFDIRGVNFIDSNVIPHLRHLLIKSAFFTDRPHLCCSSVTGPGISESTCHAPRDGISSCDNLINDILKRSLLWLFAILSLGGNIAFLLYRFFYDKSSFHNKYGFLVANLAVADIFMGIYLLIIATADAQFRDRYVLVQDEWRNSAACGTAGFIATLSCEASLMFIALITLERILVLSYPLGGHWFTRNMAAGTTVAAWMTGLTLALVPNLYPSWMIYSSNGVCLGLPMSTPLQPAAPYAIVVFLALNAAFFAFIVSGQVAILYLSMCKTVRHTGTARSTTRRSQDVRIVLQLCLVVLSNFTCWFPICVLSIVSLTGNDVSPDWYALLLIFFTPINSVINPMIYTAFTIFGHIRAPSRNSRAVELEMH